MNPVFNDKGESVELPKEVMDIIDALNDEFQCFIVVNKMGSIVQTSRGFEHFTGWARDLLLGRRISVMLEKADQGIHKAHVTGFMSGADTYTSMAGGREVTFLKPNGDKFLAQIQILKEGDFAMAFLRNIRPYHSDIYKAAQRAAKSPLGSRVIAAIIAAATLFVTGLLSMIESRLFGGTSPPPVRERQINTEEYYNGQDRTEEAP